MRVAATVTLLLLAATVLAHPQHRTTAQVEANLEKNVLEVGLRVHPEDLEQALNHSEPTSEQIVAYLQARFVLAQDGKVSGIRWVGQERDGSDRWLYFEAPFTNGAAELSNRVFFEIHKNQINVVQLSIAGKTRTVSLTADRPTLRFEIQHQLSRTP